MEKLFQKDTLSYEKRQSPLVPAWLWDKTSQGYLLGVCEPWSFTPVIVH